MVLADHTKWGVIGMSTIANLGDADMLISDSGLSAEARETLGAHVRELRIARVSDTEPEAASALS